jgi:signal transduction histidine kinase
LVACFRIVQEGVTNILRHAKASRMAVTLRPVKEGVEVAIEDDGVGFSVKEAMGASGERSHLGLIGIQERVRTFNGQFHISSAKGKGTRLSAMIPFDEAV